VSRDTLRNTTDGLVQGFHIKRLLADVATVRQALRLGVRGALTAALGKLSPRARPTRAARRASTGQPRVLQYQSFFPPRTISAPARRASTYVSGPIAATMCSQLSITAVR